MYSLESAFHKRFCAEKKCVSVSDYWQFYSPLITLFNIASSFRILSEPDDFRSISHLEKYHHLGIFCTVLWTLSKNNFFGIRICNNWNGFFKKGEKCVFATLKLCVSLLVWKNLKAPVANALCIAWSRGLEVTIQL